MKRFALLALLLAACASSPNAANEPAVTAQLADVHFSGDVRFANQIAVQFRVQVTNSTAETVRLRKVELHTAATGAFGVRVTNNYDIAIPAGQSTVVELNATGSSVGGRFAPDEPVMFRGSAYIDTATGSFVKMFESSVRPTDQ